MSVSDTVTTLVITTLAQCALVCRRPRNFTQYRASILNVWWETFPTFNLAKSKATWPKFRKILPIRLPLVTQ